jgi:hypothetical protein
MIGEDGALRFIAAILSFNARFNTRARELLNTWPRMVLFE